MTDRIRTVKFFNDNRERFERMGCNLTLLADAVRRNKFRPLDRVPLEHMKFIFGQATDIEGVKHLEQPDVVARLRYFVEAYPRDARVVCQTGKDSLCCDPEKRPFNPFLSTKAKGGKLLQEKFLMQ